MGTRRSRLNKAISLLAAVFVACGPAQSLPSEPASPRPHSPSPSQIPTELQLQPAVPPSIKATIPSGIAPEIATYVTASPGVAAAARVTLGNIVVDIDGTPSEISIAGVDAKEFQPLAPDVTSQASFVWRGIRNGQLVVAHEERTRLGVDPSDVMIARGPAGQLAMRIAGVATNGVPNIAGVMTPNPSARA